jgi:hypothetical protein
MGFWIHLLNDTVLQVEGSVPASVEIDLRTGWNLIGYPSMTDRRIDELFDGLPLERVESFAEGRSPYYLQHLDTSDYMAPGHGYWVKVSSDCKLTISA